MWCLFPQPDRTQHPKLILSVNSKLATSHARAVSPSLLLWSIDSSQLPSQLFATRYYYWVTSLRWTQSRMNFSLRKKWSKKVWNVLCWLVSPEPGQLPNIMYVARTRSRPRQSFALNSAYHINKPFLYPPTSSTFNSSNFLLRILPSHSLLQKGRVFFVCSTITWLIFKHTTPGRLKHLYAAVRKKFINTHSNKKELTNPGDIAVYGVGLRPLDCWDRAFQYRWGHGYSSLVTVVCVLSGRGLCDGPISRPEESYRLRCV